MEHPLTWFSLLPLLKELPVHVSGALFVGLLLIILSIIYYRKVKSTKDVLIPDSRLTLRNLMEIIGESSLVAEGSPEAILRGRIERMYRAALILTFGGGTNEVQRDIIAMAGLGMPHYKN